MSEILVSKIIKIRQLFLN